MACSPTLRDETLDRGHDADRSRRPDTMACCQVALSTSDIARSHWWYRRALGFRLAGERRHREGPLWAAVPGLPEAAFDVWCLVGSRPFCQIEMFEFQRPRPRAMPDRRISDFGYSMLGLQVSDVEEALDRLAIVGGSPVTEPVGEPGARRVCLRDPDDILIELMESNPLVEDRRSDDLAPDAPAIASITVSVHSLDQVADFWGGVLDLEELSPCILHDDSHEPLWGGDDGKRQAAAYRSGDVVLEFLRYETPRRCRPAGYLISDIGILNVALGSTNRDAFDATYERAVRNGFRGHTEPWSVPGVATVVYLEDGQGLSIELLHVEPGALDRMGFTASDHSSGSA